MTNVDPIIINSIVFLGVTGLIFGLLLGFAAKKLAVHIDAREDAILGILAGANCGACGYPGCSGYAAALVKGIAEPGRCTVIPISANNEIAKILGKETSGQEQKVAIIFCDGGNKCKNKMEYKSIRDCNLAAYMFGGNKECIYGCIGFGTCVSKCPFGAISMVEGSVPVIDPAKCTGCGVCVSSCPKDLIELVPCRFQYHILCKSEDKPSRVKEICASGCIGCGICARLCKVKDIIIENSLAMIKYQNCNNCGICSEKCPVATINNYKRIYSKVLEPA